MELGNYTRNDKAHKKNVDKMPTVEKVNYDMTNYLQDIEEYIEKFKKSVMPLCVPPCNLF